jgi:hypothetical protein
MTGNRVACSFKTMLTTRMILAARLRSVRVVNGARWQCRAHPSPGIGSFADTGVVRFCWTKSGQFDKLLETREPYKL